MSFTNQEVGWIGEAAGQADTDRGIELLREHFGTGYRLAEACQAADRLRAREAERIREAVIRDIGATVGYVPENFNAAEMGTILAASRDTGAEPAARLAASFAGERLAAAVRAAERMRARQPIRFADGSSIERDAPDEETGAVVSDRTAYRATE